MSGWGRGGAKVNEEGREEEEYGGGMDNAIIIFKYEEQKIHREIMMVGDTQREKNLF